MVRTIDNAPAKPPSKRKHLHIVHSSSKPACFHPFLTNVLQHLDYSGLQNQKKKMKPKKN